MAALDLAGTRFGRLVVLYQDGHRERADGVRIVTWRCRCDCGTERSVTRDCLQQGYTRSCGCIKRDKRVQKPLKSPIRRAKDLTGQIFGALRVIEWAGTATAPSKSGWHPSQISQWLCRCDCGQSLIVKSCNLKRGWTTSCGCKKAVSASKKSVQAE